MEQQKPDYGALSFAAAMNDFDTVRDLLRRGADVNEVFGSESNTPLITAAHDNNLAMVKLLVGKGADIDALDRNNDTALMWASCRGHVEVVRFLIEAGANRALRDLDGDTALTMMGPNNRAEITRLLEEPAEEIERRLEARAARAAAAAESVRACRQHATAAARQQRLKKGATPVTLRPGPRS